VSVADAISSEQAHVCKPRVFEAFATLRSWVSPLPQPKCTYSVRASKPRASESASLNVNGLTTIQAVHYDENDVSTGIAPDDSAAHNVWWKSEESGVGKKRKASESKQLPRGGRQYLQGRDDHPAYRARGRKVSRAIA
jgi:hypothetical protein